MGDWVWYLGAGLLGVTGVVLFWWAWFGDRALGRARCGGCWYSLDALMSAAAGEGSVLAVCPECGWRGKRRGSYFQTRRRRWWAVVAVLVALGAAACGVTPKARRDGVWSVAPDWFVRRLAVSGWQPASSFVNEVEKRFGGQAWEHSGFARAVYKGNRWLRLTRDTWVKGVPLRVKKESSYGHTGALSGLMFTSAECDWIVGNDADPFRVQSHENWWEPGSAAIVPRSSGQQELLLGVAATTTQSTRWDLRADFDSRIALVDSIDIVMTPTTAEPGRVRDALKPSMFVLPTTTNLALSVSNLPINVLGSGVNLGLRADLEVGGRIVATARWYQVSGDASMTGRPVLVRFGDYASTYKNNGPMTRSIESLVADGCIVRFSTDVEMALCAFECEKYWRGSFEVPLKDLVK